jgi:hypothetical protein
VSDPRPSRELRAFRSVLVLTAGLLLALGIAGLFAPGVLHTMFGPKVLASSRGYAAMSRLFGVGMVALGVGSLLAAARPERNRTMLLTLFVGLAGFVVTMIVSTTKDELSRGVVWIYAVIGFVLLMLLFRFYPRARTEADPPAPPVEDEPRM